MKDVSTQHRSLIIHKYKVKALSGSLSSIKLEFIPAYIGRSCLKFNG